MSKTLKKSLALLLVLVMALSCMSVGAMADEVTAASDDDAIAKNAVASATVEGVTKYYTSLMEAIDAAYNGGTVKLLSDVTVEHWHQNIWTLEEGAVTFPGTKLLRSPLEGPNGLVIDGNKHSLTVNHVDSGTNGNALFSGSRNLTVQNLTINAAAGVNGIGLKSGSIENVTFNMKGANPAIYTSGSNGNAANEHIEIRNCTFNTDAEDSYAIYSNEADSQGIYHSGIEYGTIISGNTFNTCRSIALRSNTQFLNNWVNSEKGVTIAGDATNAVVRGNYFPKTNTGRSIKIYPAPQAVIEGNVILGPIELEEGRNFDPAPNLSGNYWTNGVAPANLPTEPVTPTYSSYYTQCVIYSTPAEDGSLFALSNLVNAGGENYVAQIGNTGYATLAEAVAAVPDTNVQTTITLLKDVQNGVGFKTESGQNVLIDFNGKTFDVMETVGSSGTETNGCQLKKGSTVYMKNGTITSHAYNPNGNILIQNYSNLTLEDMTVDSTNFGYNPTYAVSNNFGSLTVKGNTTITAKTGGCAFDLWYGMSGDYDTGVAVTFDQNFTGTVKGTIEYGAANRVTNTNWQEKAPLVIQGNGTFTGAFASSNSATGKGLDANSNITISGGTFSTKPDVSYIAENYVAKPENGKYRVVSYSDLASGGASDSAAITVKNTVDTTDTTVNAVVNELKKVTVESNINSDAIILKVKNDESQSNTSGRLDVELTNVTVKNNEVKSVTFEVQPKVIVGDSEHDATPSEPIKVVLTVPSTFDMSQITVLHQKSSGGTEIVNGTKDEENHTFTFWSKDFSPYTIVNGDTDYSIEVLQVTSDTQPGYASTKPATVNKTYHSGDTVYEALVINGNNGNVYQGATFTVTYDPTIFELGTVSKMAGVDVTDDNGTITVITQTRENFKTGSTVVAVLPFTVKSDLERSNDGVYRIALSDSTIANDLTSTVSGAMSGDEVTIKNFYKVTIENPGVVAPDSGLALGTNDADTTDPNYLKYNTAENAAITLTNDMDMAKYSWKYETTGLEGYTLSANTVVTSIPWANVVDDVTIKLTATPNTYHVAAVTSPYETLYKEVGTTAVIGDDVNEYSAKYGTDYKAYIKDYKPSVYNYTVTATLGGTQVAADGVTILANSGNNTVGEVKISGARLTGTDKSNLVINVTKTLKFKIAVSKVGNDYINGWTLILVGANDETGFTYGKGTPYEVDMILDERYPNTTTTSLASANFNFVDATDSFNDWSGLKVYACLVKGEVNVNDVAGNLTVTNSTGIKVGAMDYNVNTSSDQIVNFGDTLQTYRAGNIAVHTNDETKAAGTQDAGYSAYVLGHLRIYLLADANGDGKATTADLSTVKTNYSTAANP